MGDNLETDDEGNEDTFNDDEEDEDDESISHGECSNYAYSHARAYIGPNRQPQKSLMNRSYDFFIHFPIKINKNMRSFRTYCKTKSS